MPNDQAARLIVIATEAVLLIVKFGKGGYNEKA